MDKNNEKTPEELLKENKKNMKKSQELFEQIKKIMQILGGD